MCTHKTANLFVIRREFLHKLAHTFRCRERASRDENVVAPSPVASTKTSQQNSMIVHLKKNYYYLFKIFVVCKIKNPPG